jgi:hypothetical protein
MVSLERSNKPDVDFYQETVAVEMVWHQHFDVEDKSKEKEGEEEVAPPAPPDNSFNASRYFVERLSEITRHLTAPSPSEQYLGATSVHRKEGIPDNLETRLA